jgi:hypothetical protein
MLFSLFIAFQLFYSVKSHISCYNCPLQSNIFDYIITADNIPENLKNCSFIGEQLECSIRVTWIQDPNNTEITLQSTGERRDVSDEHNLEHTITLNNNGFKLQYTKSIHYVCATEECNSPSTLKRLLRSLTSKDDFYELSYLLALNQPFDGTSCEFFANTSSMSCETEMNQTSCNQCMAQEFIQSTSLETCQNCVNDDIIENFITREMRFFMSNRERHDFWMIECQFKDCNNIDTGNFIRQKSTIQFDFDFFLNVNNKSTNLLSMSIIALVLMVLSIKFFH